MKHSKPKVVILCGGLGTRLKEETEYRPKPLVKIGEMPILWHIMKIYSHYGYNDFVLCLGYKGEMIKEYFLNYEWMSNDFTINLKSGRERVTRHTHETEDWTITFAETGSETPTGGRIKKIEKYVRDDDYFLATYGDGIATMDISELVNFHKAKGKIATLTGTHPISKYGKVKYGVDGIITSFEEKPALEDIVNGGFFIFNKEIFDYMDENCILEDDVLSKLAVARQLAIFVHRGFWHCMDTYKDFITLNEMWNSGNSPWKIWNK